MKNKNIIKKLTVLTLCLTAILYVVCACASDNDDRQPVSVSYLAYELLDECDFPAMYELPAEDIEGTFGVSSDNFVEVYAAVADEYPLIERILVGKLNSDADKEAVINDLNENFEALKNDYAGYAPEEYAKAKNVKIYEKNGLVCFVIVSDYSEAIEVIKENN